ncbi:MAG: YkgJ family cysteine cluster protein [Verrucomicrobiota bacterium]
MLTNHSVSEKLCLTCGLCCNGVIFANVQLQSGDPAERLKALGLRLLVRRKSRAVVSVPSGEQNGTRYQFPQPCSAFDGCHCQIYQERPTHCHAFACALLKSVQLGRTNPASATRTIEKARMRAEKVRELLRQLGDNDEQVALSLRFRKTAKRLQEEKSDGHTADIFSQLTLAAHDLNLILSEKFYPGHS